MYGPRAPSSGHQLQPTEAPHPRLDSGHWLFPWWCHRLDPLSARVWVFSRSFSVWVLLQQGDAWLRSPGCVWGARARRGGCECACFRLRQRSPMCWGVPGPWGAAVWVAGAWRWMKGGCLWTPWPGAWPFTWAFECVVDGAQSQENTRVSSERTVCWCGLMGKQLSYWWKMCCLSAGTHGIWLGRFTSLWKKIIIILFSLSNVEIRLLWGTELTWFCLTIFEMEYCLGVRVNESV